MDGAQSPRTQPRDRRAREGGAAESTGPSMLSGLHALVIDLASRMEAQESKLRDQGRELFAQAEKMIAQDGKITVLQQRNSELWKEIIRLRGKLTGQPRLPPELLLMIVECAHKDKKALKTFSLVCKSWMGVAREILFATIEYRAILPFRLRRRRVLTSHWIHPLLAILDNPYCTVFPYVQVITIDSYMDDDDPVISHTWLDDFLVHMPKFSSLKSLELYTLDSAAMYAIDRVIPYAIKRNIRELQMHCGVSTTCLAAFVSKFTNLTSLACGEMEGYLVDFEDLFDTDEELVSPPSSITKLILFDADGWSTDYLRARASIMQWFTILHTGSITSLSPHTLPNSHPGEFRQFIKRFGTSLSEIKVSSSNFTVQLDWQYLLSLKQLKHIVFQLNFQMDLPIPAILGKLPHIERITILSWESSRSEMPWSELDQTIAKTLPYLCNLTVVMHSEDYSPPKEKDNLRKKLGELLPYCVKNKFLASSLNAQQCGITSRTHGFTA
ncbi:hypothetical protein B0H14DRAFT_3072451, partial [Mycena olivaceomarginata]